MYVGSVLRLGHYHLSIIKDHVITPLPEPTLRRPLFRTGMKDGRNEPHRTGDRLRYADTTRTLQWVGYSSCAIRQRGRLLVAYRPLNVKKDSE